MTQPFLYMRNRSATDPQCAVFKEINRQLVQIGNDFGNTENLGVAPYRANNRAIHWENDIYAVNGVSGIIFKFNVATNGLNGTGDWEIFYTFLDIDPQALDIYAMGLIPCSIDGSGVLITAYPATDGGNRDIKIVKIDKDLNVTEGPASDVLINHALPLNEFSSPTPFRNSVVWQNTSTGRIFSYDLKTDTLTTALMANWSSSGAPGNSQIAILRDKAWVIDQSLTGAGDIGIWRLEGGSAPEAGVITGDDHRCGADGCFANIGINDRLYVCGPRGPLAGDIRLYEIILDSNNNVSTVNDITSLLPTEITTLVPGENLQCMWRVDTTTNGPGNPIYELEISVGDAATRSLFNWDSAPTGNLSFIGNAMTGREFGWVDVTEGSSGPYIWSGSGTLNVSQPCLTLNLDGLTIDCDFEVFGAVGASGISLEIYFDKEGEVDLTRGTINSTTLGVLAGNRVTGLAAGDKLKVGWSAVADGIVTGDNPKLHGRVFIP